MASVPTSPDNLTGYPSRFGPNRSPAAAELGPVEPPLFRFRLRQLFYFVAVVSFILAATVLSQGVAALALLLAALVVTAHVFSTALASRLRSQSDDAQALARALGTGPQFAGQFSANSHVPTIPRSARSPWHSRGSTSLPWLPRLILAGVMVGGILGVSVLGLTIGHRTTLAGVIVGGLSSAVLGGWFAFLVGSFYGIFRHGLRDALAEQRKDERHVRSSP